MIRWRITQGSLIQYGSVSNFRSGPLETSLDHNTWIRAAMAALAKGGVDQIRVEVIAQNLGVTKGGFYRRFKDRPALIEATLAVWAEGRIAAIEEQTRLAGARPSTQKRSTQKEWRSNSTYDNGHGRAPKLPLSSLEWTMHACGVSRNFIRISVPILERPKLRRSSSIHLCLGKVCFFSIKTIARDPWFRIAPTPWQKSRARRLPPLRRGRFRGNRMQRDAVFVEHGLGD
jgi:AcrR family transcriptional regulator